MRRADWSRRMKRSPLSAATGLSVTSCASADSPGLTEAPRRIEILAVTSPAPMCKWTGVQCFSGCVSDSSTFTRTSMRCVGACKAGHTAQSPRATCATSAPVRFNAQRSPALAPEEGLPSFWIPRTRTSMPAGVSISLSPAATAPLNTVPVTTVPLPATLKTRSIAKRNCRPCCASRPILPAAAARAARSVSIPSPESADTGSRSIPARPVVPSSSRTLSVTSSTRCGVTRSILVIAAMPRRTDSNSTILRCSIVWGMTPSSAATASRTKSMPHTPASMLRTNRSCPGTSTNPMVASAGVRQ